MTLVIQRVLKASVTVNGREIVSIGGGLVVLVGFAASEPEIEQRLPRLAKNVIQLRIFDDGSGRMNRSLRDVDGELLLIPEITLTARLEKGTRPSFHTAASPETARGLFEAFAKAIRATYTRVHTGTFQANMLVRIDNDGPVTFILGS